VSADVTPLTSAPVEATLTTDAATAISTVIASAPAVFNAAVDPGPAALPVEVTLTTDAATAISTVIASAPAVFNAAVDPGPAALPVEVTLTTDAATAISTVIASAPAVFNAALDQGLAALPVVVVSQPDNGPSIVVASPAVNSLLATNPAGPIVVVVMSAGKVVISVVNAFAMFPDVLASLYGSQTPVHDVITAVQTMLTPVVDSVIEFIEVSTDSVVQLMRAPADLAALLGFPAPSGPMTPMTERASGTAPRAQSVAPLAMLIPTQLPPAQATSAVQDVQLLANVSEFSMLDHLAMASFSQSGRPDIAKSPEANPTAAEPSLVKEFISKILVPVSLWTLVTAVLPGLGGMIIMSGAGVRIGYNQAKAGVMLRASGLMRLAGQGPIGVVVSGSMVAIRPRAVRRIGSDRVGVASKLREVA
jgi:hypothetical protein